jgi:hypothetical protein
MGLLEYIPPEIFNGLMGAPGAPVPAFPIILGYSINAYHHATGIPAPEILRDGHKVAAAQIQVARQYHLPCVIST